MLCISLFCYGKQTIVTDDRSKRQSASADGCAGTAFDNEIMLNDVEQPKHLMVYDLGLGDTTDQAFQYPLMATANMRAIKNDRIRSLSSRITACRWQERQVEYMQARQEHEEIRQERQHTVPPLRRDNFRQTERSQQDRESSESQQRGRDRSTPRGARASTPARASASASGSTPPWREDRGRQRSATPQGRRTRSRTGEGHSRGAHWTNTGYQQRQQQQYHQPTQGTAIRPAASSRTLSEPTSRSELLPTTILQVQPAQLFRRVRAWLSVALWALA